MSVTVSIVGTYENGHRYSRVVEVREPRMTEAMDDWWEDAVSEHCGDGVFEKTGYCHTATILRTSEGWPAGLRGKTYEWAGI